MPAFWGASLLRIFASIGRSQTLPLHPQHQHAEHEIRQPAGGPPDIGDTTHVSHASYAAVSMVCMLLVAALFGSRFHPLSDRRYWRNLSFIGMLPYFLYFFGITFNLAATLSVAALDLTVVSACRTAMYICLVFYVATKVCVQLFLIERAHVIRQKDKKRIEDYIWLGFVSVVVTGFGTIAILAFIGPTAVVDTGDEQCRIGLPRVSLMVLMTYDILINAALTVVFLMLLRPYLRMRRSTMHDLPGVTSATLTDSPRPIRPPLGLKQASQAILARVSNSSSDTEGSSLPPQAMAALNSPDTNRDHLRQMVLKSVVGTVVMVTATILNLMLLWR